MYIYRSCGWLANYHWVITRNRCKTDLNSFPRRKLDETTGTSSYYMDENHPAGSEIQRPQCGRRSWLGSELSTLEIDVYVWRYALLVVLARNDDDEWVLNGLDRNGMLQFISGNVLNTATVVWVSFSVLGSNIRPHIAWVLFLCLLVYER